MNAFKRNLKNTLVVAAVLAAMTVVTSQGWAADLHYLAVGVSKVPSLPANSQLRFAHKDAEDLAKTWNTQKGLLYKNVTGETMINEEAKLADILAGLERLEARAKTGDTVVVSFAGHGAVVGRRITQWMFVPSDFNPYNARETALHEWKLREHLARVTKRGVTVILVLDTCHSGAFATGDSGVVVFAGCTTYQESFEDDIYKNGLFTHAMLEALKGQADANNDGVVTLAEIEAYLVVRVTQMHAQNPAFDQNGSRLEQLPTCNRPAGMQHQMPLVGGPAATTSPASQVNGGQNRIRTKTAGR